VLFGQRDREEFLGMLERLSCFVYIDYEISVMIDVLMMFIGLNDVQSVESGAKYHRYVCVRPASASGPDGKKDYYVTRNLLVRYLDRQYVRNGVLRSKS